MRMISWLQPHSCHQTDPPRPAGPVNTSHSTVRVEVERPKDCLNLVLCLFFTGAAMHSVVQHVGTEHSTKSGETDKRQDWVKNYTKGGSIRPKILYTKSVLSSMRAPKRVRTVQSNRHCHPFILHWQQQERRKDHKALLETRSIIIKHMSSLPALVFVTQSKDAIIIHSLPAISHIINIKKGDRMVKSNYQL